MNKHIIKFVNIMRIFFGITRHIQVNNCNREIVKVNVHAAHTATVTEQRRDRRVEAVFPEDAATAVGPSSMQFVVSHSRHKVLTHPVQVLLDVVSDENLSSERLSQYAAVFLPGVLALSDQQS